MGAQEDVSEFKYFGCVLSELGKDRVECSTKKVSGRIVAGIIRSLERARNLQLLCLKALHEGLVVSFNVSGETILWRERVRSRSRAVQMENLRL